MNPLIPNSAVQLRYESPLYEPIYDEDDNVIDEECVNVGTDILATFIEPVMEDRIPRYYRLRYTNNAKDHKRRWSQWVLNTLGTGQPYFVRVSKIGRRVLFTYDPKLESKHIRKVQHIEKIRRIQEREESQLRSSIAAESGGTWYQLDEEQREDPHDPDYYQAIEQALERMSQEYGE